MHKASGWLKYRPPVCSVHISKINNMNVWLYNTNLYLKRERREVVLKTSEHLELVPVSLKEANAFVERYHRHHRPVVGHKFSIGAASGGKIVGVAIVGRPVSRHLDDGWTLEVNRLCTNGTKNVCSFLYSAAWRCARNMGYKKLITYILDTETGTSLKAANWKCVGQAGGKCWTGVRRPTIDLYPAQMKLRFEITETEKENEK